AVRALHSFPTRRSSDLAGPGTAELHLMCGYRTRERLHIGIDCNYAGLLQTVEHNSIESVQACATNAHNFHRNSVCQSIRQTVIRSEEHTSELQSPDHLV